MTFHIQEIDASQYPLYDQIPNWFKVESILAVQAQEGGLGGLSMREMNLAQPYIKDYDHDRGDRPSQWAKELNLSGWGIFIILYEGQPVGGVAISPDPSDVFPMDNFQPGEMAVLWDLRVHPEQRGAGVGAALFDHAANWARQREYRWLGIETSNVNVPACRLYAGKGCQLGAIHRFGYARAPQVAHEVMLLWYLKL
jgi:GNAT superfamily N-acetyltransferase